MKHHAKWGYGCENWRFHALGISQPFHSYEMELLCCEMALVCQEKVSQLRKFSQRGVLGCEIISQHSGVFAAAPWGCEMISQRSGDFAGEIFGCEISQALNFSFAFELHFSSKRPSFIFFEIPPTIDHSKR